MNHKPVLAALAASLLAFGAAAQAQSLNPRGDLDRDGIQNRVDGDRDGDGIPNARDPHPNRPDRIAHVARTGPRGDMDGDGVLNRHDRFPNNPRRS